MKTFEGPRQLRWRRKRTEEGRMLIQNKRVSSQQIFEKEGATVAASHLPSLSWLSHRPDWQRSPQKTYFTGSSH